MILADFYLSVHLYNKYIHSVWVSVAGFVFNFLFFGGVEQFPESSNLSISETQRQIKHR